MQSTITKPEKASKQQTFPVLKQWIPEDGWNSDTVMVVMFTNQTTGTVLHCTGQPSNRKVGETANNFINCTDTDSWVDFDGEVILKN